MLPHSEDGGSGRQSLAARLGHFAVLTDSMRRLPEESSEATATWAAVPKSFSKLRSFNRPESVGHEMRFALPLRSILDMANIELRAFAPRDAA